MEYQKNPMYRVRGKGVRECLRLLQRKSEWSVKKNNLNLVFVVFYDILLSVLKSYKAEFTNTEYWNSEAYFDTGRVVVKTLSTFMHESL